MDMKPVKLTDPKTARRLKIKRIERWLVYIIGIATALRNDLEQAADTEGYRSLDDISREWLADAITALANQAVTELGELE